MRLFYKMLQKTLRKCIDWLMSLWLWANRHEKLSEERKKWK